MMTTTMIATATRFNVVVDGDDFDNVVNADSPIKACRKAGYYNVELMHEEEGISHFMGYVDEHTLVFIDVYTC